MKQSMRKDQSATKATAAFSFSSEGPLYAKKDQLATEGVAFAIQAIEYDRGGSLNGGDRWKVTILRADNGTTEIVTLDANTKRDAQLEAAKNHLLANRPIQGVRLVKHGNAFYFRTAAPPSS